MAIVALVFGGPSDEHDVSLVSAKSILTALQKSPHDVLALGICKDKRWKLLRHGDLLATSFEKPIDLNQLGTEVSLCRKQGAVYAIDMQHNQVMHGAIDVAFPICHGPYGEDGRLQGFFEILGLPYVGTGVAGCAVGLDKALSKTSLVDTDIPQAPFLLTTDQEISFAAACEKLQPPLFVKPIRMGSSVGISKVENQAEFAQALKLAFQFDCKVIIEQGVKGQEIECAVMEKDGEICVSGTSEIIVNHSFYSYEAKYLDPNGAEFIYPANINQKTTEEIKIIAKKAFEYLGCRDFVRADFFVAKEGKVYFNELNTHPGFTSISQFPKLWELEGINNTQLCEHLLALAMERGKD